MSGTSMSLCSPTTFEPGDARHEKERNARSVRNQEIQESQATQQTRKSGPLLSQKRQLHSQKRQVCYQFSTRNDFAEEETMTLGKGGRLSRQSSLRSSVGSSRWRFPNLLSNSHIVSFIYFNPSPLEVQTCVKADLLFKSYKSKSQWGMKISTVQYCSVHVVDGVNKIWGHLTVQIERL